MFITSQKSKFKKFTDAYISITDLVTPEHHEVIKTTKELDFLHSTCNRQIIIYREGYATKLKFLRNKILVIYPDMGTKINIILAIFNYKDIKSQHDFKIHIEQTNPKLQVQLTTGKLEKEELEYYTNYILQ